MKVPETPQVQAARLCERRKRVEADEIAERVSRHAFSALRACGSAMEALY